MSIAVARTVVSLLAASAAAAGLAAAQETTPRPHLTLVGTGVARSNGEAAWALIKNTQTGEEEPIQLTESVFGLGTLTQVSSTKIEIASPQGARTQLYLAGGSAEISPSVPPQRAHSQERQELSLPGNNPVKTITSGLLALEDFAGHEKEERRMIDSEELPGVVYDELPANSLLTMLGVQPNDFIYLINGQNVCNASEMYYTGNYLINIPDGEISVQVLRDGKQVLLSTKLPQQG